MEEVPFVVPLKETDMNCRICGRQDARIRLCELNTARITKRAHVDCNGHSEYRSVTVAEIDLAPDCEAYNAKLTGNNVAQRSWHPRGAPCYVAALFVQPDGCYSQVPWVDMWPEDRDARNYMGPLPVVAHPPCQLWGAMAAVNYARWGGEHNRPGNDGGCFASALASVNRWGGVLEHPAKTMAWAEHGLKKPAGIGWQRSGKGWVCEVWQSAYGHRANKATWLYYVGHTPPFELRWDRPKGTHQIGFHDQRGKAANKPTLGKREANATPIEFRDELLKLAMNADAYERRCFATARGSRNRT